MTASVLGLVAALAFVAIPIQKNYVEDIVKDSLNAAAEWMGQVASTSFEAQTGLPDLSPLSLQQMSALTPMLVLARIQELSDADKNNVAYLALVDQSGAVLFSDQMGLVGETLPLPAEKTITDETFSQATRYTVDPLRW